MEASVDRMADLGLRVAKVRIGIVLGPGSGVMATLLPVFAWIGRALRQRAPLDALDSCGGFGPAVCLPRPAP